MKVPGRKVLKLGVSESDLERFVQANKDLKVGTLSETLTKLLDTYERSKSSSTSCRSTLLKGAH